jgi:trimethylamine--corrinoid protein Co-methyltransferase
MYSETPDIIALNSPLKTGIFTGDELASIQEKTLYLLDEVGIHFPSTRALEIFADHGARVDMDAEIVHIPPEMVNRAMATAPRAFVLGGREQRFD